MLEPDRQRILDEEHLRLLRIGYFISGGAAAFLCLFGLLYVVMGLFFVSALSSIPSPHGGQPPPAVGWIIVGFFGLFVLAGAALATLKFLTARALGQRRSHMLCMITAGLTCISIPYGTFLGVCTFIVLGRPTVQAMFGVGSVPPISSTAVPGPPPIPPVT